MTSSAHLRIGLCGVTGRVAALTLLVGSILAVQAAAAADADAERVRILQAIRKDPADGFFTVKYSGYVIKTDIDADFGAASALYLRRFYEAFRSFFKPEPKLKATPVVYLFRDRDSYRAFVRKRDYKEIENASGAYVGSDTRSELFCFHTHPGGGFKTFPTETLRHEGAHQLLSYIVGAHGLPVWYDEGVATFFEGWDVERTREENLARLQETHTRFGLIAKAYGTNEFRSLSYLVNLDRRAWVPDNFGPKTAVHYAEVQSFMTFLLVSEKGRRFFAEIFRVVAAGQDPARMLSRKTIESAEKAWYKDIEERIERLKKPPADPFKKVEDATR